MRISTSLPSTQKARFRVAFTRSELKSCTGFEEPYTGLKASLRRITDDQFEVSFGKNCYYTVSKTSVKSRRPDSTGGEISVTATDFGLVNRRVVIQNISPNIQQQKINFIVPKWFLASTQNEQERLATQQRVVVAQQQTKDSEEILRDDFKEAIAMVNEIAKKLGGNISFKQKEDGRLYAIRVAEEEY